MYSPIEQGDLEDLEDLEDHGDHVDHGDHGDQEDQEDQEDREDRANHREDQEDQANHQEDGEDGEDREDREDGEDGEDGEDREDQVTYREDRTNHQEDLEVRKNKNRIQYRNRDRSQDRRENQLRILVRNKSPKTNKTRYRNRSRSRSRSPIRSRDRNGIVYRSRNKSTIEKQNRNRNRNRDRRVGYQDQNKDMLTGLNRNVNMSSSYPDVDNYRKINDVNQPPFRITYRPNRNKLHFRSISDGIVRNRHRNTRERDEPEDRYDNTSQTSSIRTFTKNKQYKQPSKQSRNKNTSSWEENWPPTLLFNIMQDEVNKYIGYAKEGDNTKLHTLTSDIRAMDSKLRKVKSCADFKVQFGAEQAAELMVYHIATNGTLRSRLNRIGTYVVGNGMTKSNTFADIL